MTVYGVPSSGAKPIRVKQTATYWSNGSASSCPFTITAPTQTLIACVGLESSGKTFYTVTHTGYSWRLLGRYRVDDNYPCTEIWIGQPSTYGVSGGTTVTFAVNGTASFTGGMLFELSRRLKGEQPVGQSYGWGNSSTAPQYSYPVNPPVTPPERGVLTVYVCGQNSGGVGPTVQYTPPNGSSGVGGLYAGVIGVLPPSTPINVNGWVTNPSRSQHWSHLTLFVR